MLICIRCISNDKPNKSFYIQVLYTWRLETYLVVPDRLDNIFLCSAHLSL